MLIYLFVGIFFGFIFSIISMTILPDMTVKVLEVFKFFKKGALTVTKSTRNMGAGSNQGKNITYLHKGKAVNARVVAFILIVYCSVFAIASVVLFLVLGSN